MKSCVKQLATFLLLFGALFLDAQKAIPDNQQYAEFYYAEFETKGSTPSPILVISSYIYKLKDNFGDAASVITEPYFYQKIGQIKKEGINGNEAVLKSEIKHVYAVSFNGKMHTYLPDESISFDKNINSTTGFVLNARRAILDAYEKRGYHIYQTDFSSDFAGSSYYKRTKKEEKLLSSYIEEYKAGTVQNPVKTEPKENQNIAASLSTSSKNVKKYNKNGKLSAQGFNTPEGKETGEWKFYYENGNVSETGSFINGKETGVWKQFYENGKLKAEGNYTDGLVNGEWRTYFENGNPATSTVYKDGKVTGDAKDYSENGKLKSIATFSSDSKYVLQKLYYENGNLESEGKYMINTDPTSIIVKGGKLTPIGEWKSYHENGKLKSIGTYGGMNSKDLTGEWKIYDENGNLREKASSFIGGVPMKYEKFDEKGNREN